jgi:hypothetical protein
MFPKEDASDDGRRVSLRRDQWEAHERVSMRRRARLQKLRRSLKG